MLNRTFRSATEVTIPSGTKLGRYEIRSKIGAGGMGEVYLAEDTKLDRQIALKVLLSEVAGDEDRVRRFVREAKAASALNHPNILTVYEIGETDDGTHYIATELIDGKSLREHIAHGKPMPLNTILKIGAEVAEALSTAHHAGIIHRDIKPENIMIRKDGYLKVLDFGLAKLSETPPETSSTEDPTRLQVKTTPGMIMGTVSYMSPEQMRGKDTDARTDLWSLGVVLYEMVTRISPFEGETKSDTCAAVLTKEPPPLAQFVPTAPAELQRIVRKALAKDCDERYQTARDMMTDLKTLRRDSEMSGGLERLPQTSGVSGVSGVSTNENEPTRVFDTASTGQTAKNASTKDEKYQTLSVEIEKLKSKYRRGTTAAIGILLIGSLGYFGYLYLKPKRLIETAFNKTTLEKIPINGNVELTEISPDKRYLAYVERKSNNETRLVLRQFETGAEKEILPMGKSFVRDVEFSADGNYFYYAWETLAATNLRVDVFRVPLLGGQPERIVEDLVKGFSLSQDGKRIAFVRNQPSPFEDRIVSYDLQRKEERVLVSSKVRDFASVAFSPDGTKIGVLASDSYTDDLYKLNWISADGGELQKISDAALKGGANFGWLSDGSGLVVAAQFPDQKYGQLYKVPFPRGEFTPITTSTSTFSGVSLSRDGSFLVARQTNKTNGIWEFDLAGRSTRQIIPTTKDELKVEDITSDNRLLITRLDNQGKKGLWLTNLDGSNEKLVTPFNADNSGPLQQAAITNDERFCYYVSDNDVWRIGLDGSGKEKLTNTPSVAKAFGSISRDSSYVFFNILSPPTIQRLDLATRLVAPVLESESTGFFLFGFTRNNELIAYTTFDLKSQRGGFFLARFDGNKISEQKPLVDVPRSNGFLFSRDGNKVYFTPYAKDPTEINDAEMSEKDLVSGKILKITNFNIDRILNYTISRDGTKLYLVRGNRTDEVVLIRSVD